MLNSSNSEHGAGFESQGKDFPILFVVAFFWCSLPKSWVRTYGGKVRAMSAGNQPKSKWTCFFWSWCPLFCVFQGHQEEKPLFWGVSHKETHRVLLSAMSGPGPIRMSLLLLVSFFGSVHFYWGKQQKSKHVFKPQTTKHTKPKQTTPTHTKHTPQDTELFFLPAHTSRVGSRALSG